MADYSGPIEEPEIEHDMSPREIAICDAFVIEYLVDYDQKAAAKRLGYSDSLANEYGSRFMGKPYVAQKIRLQETATASDTEEMMHHRILTGLIKESNYRGPGSSQGARVAALSKLAQIYSMEPPTRTKNEHSGPDGQPLGNGVFVVPGIMTTEQWTAQAAAQQEELVNRKPDDKLPHTPAVNA